MHTVRSAFTCAILGLFAIITSSATAAVIESQAPCVTANGYCMAFTNTTDPIPDVRFIRFTAPGPGTASVTFHGSMVCSNTGDDSRVVDLVSQIVPRPTDVPDASGPGGLRHAIVMFSRTAGTSDSFSLASTRDFTVKQAGRQTFYFKLAKLRMDANTSCFVFNATFTVLFVP